MTTFYLKLRAKSVVLRVLNEKVDGIDLGATNSAMEGGKLNAEFFLNMLKNDGPVTGPLSDAHFTLEEICALFCINSNGILSVTAVDKGTGKKQGITIINLSNDYEMQRMVNEVEWFAKDYKEKRDAIDIKNQAEFVVYQTENQLKELGETRFLP
ncbi:heat shock 70 kda protein 6 [Quercus suber]|uniref:Heat shock 70 kDa protein 6 n=1 Tax=Quercus suber TaxID=58331 RepID=A0AAW0KYR6_QUESU